MKILRATFLGMKGIRDVSLDFEDQRTGEPHDLVVFEGPAACGKTRTLEAMFAAKEAIAPYGGPIDGKPWIGRGMSSKTSLTFVLDEEEQTYAGTSTPIAETDVIFFPRRTDSLAFEGVRAVLERYTHGAHTGKFEYFPTTRRLLTESPYGETAAHVQRTRRWSKAANKYDFVGRFLRDLVVNPPLADAFRARLATMSPSLRYEPDGRPGRYFRSKGGDGLTLAEISDAEADAVLFTATALAIDLACSVVLVDRPDLYVDPRNSGPMIAGLRALGQDNQLFVTASSPRFVAEAEAAGAKIVSLEGV